MWGLTVAPPPHLPNTLSVAQKFDNIPHSINRRIIRDAKVRREYDKGTISSRVP